MVDEAPVPEEAEFFFPPRRDWFFFSGNFGVFLMQVFVFQIFHLFSIFFVPDFLFTVKVRFFFEWHPRNEAEQKYSPCGHPTKNEADRKSPDRKTSLNAHPMERNSMGSTFESWIPPLKTNEYPLKIDAWKMKFPFKMAPFQGDMLFFFCWGGIVFFQVIFLVRNEFSQFREVSFNFFVGKS